MVGVAMRLPEGVTLKMLQNVYNSRKRQEKIYSNARRNKVPYNANAAAAEQAFRRGIQVASGLNERTFANYYHKYMNLRKANQRKRTLSVARQWRTKSAVRKTMPRAPLKNLSEYVFHPKRVKRMMQRQGNNWLNRV